MPTGYFKNHHNAPRQVRLVKTDTSKATFKDAQGNVVVVQGSNLVINLGTFNAPVLPVTDLTATVLIL